MLLDDACGSVCILEDLYQDDQVGDTLTLTLMCRIEHVDMGTEDRGYVSAVLLRSRPTIPQGRPTPDISQCCTQCQCRPREVVRAQCPLAVPHP